MSIFDLEKHFQNDLDNWQDENGNESADGTTYADFYQQLLNSEKYSQLKTIGYR